MFAKNVKLKLLKVVAGLSVIGLVLAGIIAAIPAASAYAAPGTPPAPGQVAEARNARLEKAYQREQSWLTTQQNNLNRMNTIADKVQQFITTQQGKGKDVTALQNALTTFKTQIATALASHNTAANILNTHQGFDANGKVIDADQARQTVFDARQSLRDAHDVMRQAISDLHRAIHEWREVNGAKTNPPSTATPSN